MERTDLERTFEQIAVERRHEIERLTQNLHEHKVMLGKAIDIKNKYLEEREALKLELNAARFELGVANEAIAEHKEQRQHWKHQWQRCARMLQIYRKAVRKRLTLIANRVGQEQTVLHARIERLEETVAVFKENLAQERAKVDELLAAQEDSKYDHMGEDT